MLEINKIHLGDSYKLIKLIPDKSIDCIYVDVPYKYAGGGGGTSEVAKRIINNKMELIDSNIYDGFDYSILDEFIRISKKVNVFIWCSKMQIHEILNYFINRNYFFEILVWCKTNPTPSTNNKYLPDMEYCFHFREGGVKLNTGYELKSKFYISPINKSDKDLYDHPTIKPLPFVKRHLLHATSEKDIVLDCFSGSGTTCIAAKETKRQFIGIEIDQEFYDISINRLNGIDVRGQTSIFTDFDNLGVDE